MTSGDDSERSFAAADRELRGWATPIAFWSLIHGCGCFALLLLDRVDLSVEEQWFLVTTGACWLTSSIAIRRLQTTGSGFSGRLAAVTQGGVALLILSWGLLRRDTITIASWSFLDGLIDVSFHAAAAVGLWLTLKKYDTFLV